MIASNKPDALGRLAVSYGVSRLHMLQRISAAIPISMPTIAKSEPNSGGTGESLAAEPPAPLEQD